MRIALGLLVLMLFVASAGAGDEIAASSPVSFPARDAASFRPRANVERLIQGKRTQDEDKLRAALLACAQSDEELRTLTAMINGRWDKKAIENLGGWLVEDWDKEYGPSLRRPKCIFELLVYVRNHERPYAFKDGEDVMVTIAEGKRFEQLTGNIDTALAAYIDKLIDPKCKWPADSRSELLYNIAAAFEENGAPEMITEAIWKGMANCKKFRWDMLGVMSNLANQATLERLLKFRDSQEWAVDDLDRIDEGIRDVRWWLERAEIMAQSRPPEDEAKVVVSEEETKLMLKRVADMQAGRCPLVRLIGDSSAKASVDALSLIYTKLSVPVKAVLSEVDSDVSSIGAFVNGEGASLRELLILADKPSSRAMELHGEKWNSLGVGKDGKPDGTGPNEHMIAGRAVAVVVNPANKIESLTLGQVQAIYGGKVDDWAVVGKTGLDAVVGRGGSGRTGSGRAGGRAGRRAGGGRAAAGGRRGEIAIHAYGPYPRQPGVELFEDECLPARRWRGVKRMSDANELLAKVAMDPQAIAFIDATLVPETGASVKVLGIQVGRGEKAKVTYPVAEDIRNSMYPLAQRLHLYVHPKASDTAKDFAKFLATCGASADNPYMDVVGSVMQACRKHGLIPLADAAIERKAKDAAEAARNRKAAEKAAAGKKKAG